MKNPWFKKAGWIYIPVNLPGFIITAMFLMFCINVIYVIDHKSHSVSDMLYNIFPFVVPAFLFYIWIASETSSKK